MIRPSTLITVLLSALTTISSKPSVKFPCSPHEVGPGSSTADISADVGVLSSIVDVTTVCINCGCAARLSLRFLGASTSYIVVMIVLNRLDFDEKTSKEGSADMGIFGVVLVVG